MKKAIKAMVESICHGKHGPYAIACADNVKGSITFSLKRPAWNEGDVPKEGAYVLLEELRETRQGWRANTGRYWQLSDEQTAPGIEFLYPTSRQFPFDATAERIVRELEKRNWDVPGITISFHTYGSGHQKMRQVEEIKGADFLLRFARKQSTLAGGVWNDCSAVSDMFIPEKHLRIYDDYSGSLTLYAGDDWIADRKKFFHGFFVNSTGDHYVKYSFCCHCRSKNGHWTDGLSHTHEGQLAPLLVRPSNFEPVAGDRRFPESFKTTSVMNHFQRYLEDTVLRSILAHPIPAQRVPNYFSEPQPIPFPSHEMLGSEIFCFTGWGDAERIQLGQRNPAQLDAHMRYAMRVDGDRLNWLDIENDGTVPEVAYESFLWCGLGTVNSETDIDTLVVAGEKRSEDRGSYLVRIVPQRANDIYIADHAEYEKRRKELHAVATDDRKHFTKEEINDFFNARGRTLIPIHEYKGGYADPILLINRELDFNEVEIVSGPHESRYHKLRAAKLHQTG